MHARARDWHELTEIWIRAADLSQPRPRPVPASSVSHHPDLIQTADRVLAHFDRMHSDARRLALVRPTLSAVGWAGLALLLILLALALKDAPARAAAALLDARSLSERF